MRVFQLLEDNENIYCAMELMAKPLTRLVVGGQRPSEKKAKYIVRQLCLAINYMHNQGIVHRDLKPENILLQDENPETPTKPRIKVTDFGFATSIENRTLMQVICGSEHYMAPEYQLPRVKMDSKVDVWAIGCITYYIFQGNHAFMAKKVDQLRRQIKHG